MSLTTLVIIVLMSWAIDYINGFHDTANAIATVVCTGVLSSRYAIFMAAILNFTGALASTHIAETISKNLFDPNFSLTSQAIIAALLTSIIWNLITWYFGIPSSTSHALIGSLGGAAVATGGFLVINIKTLKTLAQFTVLAPTIGFLIGIITVTIILWICKKSTQSKLSALFGKLQLLSASAVAFTHGQNDAQKAMAIICIALAQYNRRDILSSNQMLIPLWVKIGCAIMMALGTASGGLRIIKTMGHKIVKLRPMHGFAAEASAAVVLYTTAQLGIPVSTTQAITGSIMGVGATINASSVRWHVAGNIFIAWILTIPCSFAMAYMICRLLLISANNFY